MHLWLVAIHLSHDSDTGRSYSGASRLNSLTRGWCRGTAKLTTSTEPSVNWPCFLPISFLQWGTSCSSSCWSVCSWIYINVRYRYLIRSALENSYPKHDIGTVMFYLDGSRWGWYIPYKWMVWV